MTVEDLAPTASAPSSAMPRDVSRRTVVAAAAWSVPAVSLASATPAFANTSQATNMTIAGPSSSVPASGAVPVTVTVKDAQGQPQVGQPVSFSGPDGSSFDAPDGVTNGAGQYTANFNNNKAWAKPGSTIAVTAVSESGNASQSFVVLGSNVLGWGSGASGVTGLGTAADTSTPSQLTQTFPAPVVQVAQGGDYFTLFRLADGTVWGVGRNSQGQLANGTTNDSPTPQRVQGLADVVDVAAGYQTGYAVLKDGSVRSWGVNYESALGDGSTSSDKSFSTSVVTVRGVSNAVKVAGGSWFGLALLSDGTVAGWGRNGFGQLGDTTNQNRTTATKAVGVSNVTEIAATSVAGYALRSDGTIMAWGGNWKGQQGDGSTTSGNRYTPAAVSGISTATSIAAAGEAGYALLADKTVVAWGNGENGELGNGVSAASATPVAVQGLTDVVQIGAGYALTHSGAVYAWGPNDSGQLGNGKSGPGSNVPVAVSVPAGIPIQGVGGSMGGPARYVVTGELTVSVDVVEDRLAAGSSGTVRATVVSGSAGVAGAAVSLTATGNAVLGSTLGQTNGNGDVVTTVTPDQWTMPGAQITVRASTDAAVSSDSFTVLGANVLVTGSNYNGNLGTGTTGAVSAPTQDASVFPSPVKSMSSGWMHSIALLEDGTVWTAGNNAVGQLGDGSQNVDRSTFRMIPTLSNVREISSGWNHGVALLSDGTVWTWGWNAYGALGNGTTTDSDVPLQVLANADMVAAGSLTTYARKTDGTLWAWGQNSYGGQIGDGTTTDRLTPVQVQKIPAGSVRQLAGGGEYVLALLTDGTVKSWGFNASGQLGDGSTTNRSLPVTVTGLSNVKQVAAGRFAAYALLNDGTVWAWGKNEAGQLGNNSTTDSSTPVQVAGLTGVVQLAASAQSAYVLRNDGSVQWWGGDDGFRADSGNAPIAKIPQSVSGLDGHVVTALGSGPRQTGHYYVTGTSSISVDVTDVQVTAGVASAVTAKVSAGSEGVHGAAVTLSATGNAAIGASAGTTNASGEFQTTVTPDLWTTPGDVIRVTATSGASAAQDTFRVSGANAAGAGDWLGLGVETGSVANSPTPVQLRREFTSPVVGMASNRNSGLALLKDGTVWGMGGNFYRTLADTTDAVYAWTQIPGVANAVQVAITDYTAYALQEDGTVLAWGTGEYDLFPPVNGKAAVWHTPTVISGLTGVKQIATGLGTFYAVMSDGTVKANGWGEAGQFGNGGTTNSSSFVTVPTLSGVVSIGTSAVAATALQGNGTVWYWGAGPNNTQIAPTKIPNLSNVKGVSSNVAVAGDGTVWQFEYANAATQVSGLTNVSSVASQGASFYASLPGGSVKSWGANGSGQLGDGTQTDRATPVDVAGLAGRVVTGVFPSIRGGKAHFVTGSASVSLTVATPITAGSAGAVTAKIVAGSTPVAGATLTLSASGGAALATTSGQSDSSGQLQTTVTPDAWTRPGASLSVKASSGSSSATDRYLVLGANALTSGTGTWGAAGLNEQTDGWPTNTPTPTQVWKMFRSPLVKMVSCPNSTLALLADGSVWGVGQNGYLEVSGTSGNVSPWRQLPGVANVVDVAITDYSGHAVLADGTMMLWGMNGYSQFGDGTARSASVTAPRLATGVSGVRQVIATRNTVYLIMRDGSVKAAGANDGGQIGDGTRTEAPTFKNVPGLSNITDIKTYPFGAVALRGTDGTVWQWGMSANTPSGDILTPTQVSGLSGVKQVGAGLALNADGTVSQFGIDAAASTVPGISGAAQVAANGAQYYVQFPDGSIKAWGTNNFGQLGDGTTTDRTSPVVVTGLSGRTVLSIIPSQRQQRTHYITA